MNKIEKTYNDLVNMRSDINEHLPTLKKYAMECDHVTEMGVRAIVSTYAFAVAKPKKLVCIDIIHPANDEWNSKYGSGERFDDIQQYCKENNVEYQFILGDTRKIEIEETDLLFIDTLHNYNQLKRELELNANKAKKYIIFHDTETYRFSNETNDNGSNLVDNKVGLWPAIEEFLAINPEWKIHEIFKNCNGLTVLKR